MTSALRDPALALFAAAAAHHGETWRFEDSPKFGANALRVNGKIYAALTRSHRLLLKLPSTRVTELLAAGRAGRFESGGCTMNGWITVMKRDAEEWIVLPDEARAFASAEAKSRRKSR